MKKLFTLTAVVLFSSSMIFASVQNPPKGTTNTTNANTTTGPDKTTQSNDFKGTSFGDISKSAAPKDSTSVKKTNTNCNK